MRAGNESLADTLRAEMRGGDDALRTEMRAGSEALAAALRAEMRAGNQALKKTIEDGDEQTRRYMRVLYEDLVERIATLDEGR
jgi:hypothetical protein